MTKNFLKYQLYLLQLENYELFRYWPLILKKGFWGPKQPLRKDLVWTKKAIGILGLSFMLLAALFVLLMSVNLIFALVILLFSLFLMPVYFTLVLLVIAPFDYVAKNLIIGKAKKVIKSNQKLKIIGIAGSYGKTTMKNVLATVLSAKYKVLATPESVNTPVGIANWILKKSVADCDVLILEMGEHYKGDIAYLCSIASPDIAVITGINESHIERLKTLDNAIATVFELAEHAKENATIIINGADKNVTKNYKKFAAEKEVLLYGVPGQVEEAKFDPEKLIWRATVDNLGMIETKVLGEYVLSVIAAAAAVAGKLGMEPGLIKQGISNIEPVEHRLQPIRGQGGVLVIDDSYNGNPDGVREAINLLEKFGSRRKIYLTPGLVETGKDTARIHREIGKQLAKVADKVILVKNSVTPFIAEGLKEGKFEDIIWFETAQKAHEALGGILENNDVILFQNDWGDQYV